MSAYGWSSAERLLSVQLKLCCMFCCCCLSAGAWALSPILLLSLTWCHDKSSTHCCLPWSHSVRPQGVQTCDTFQEYLMLFKSLLDTAVTCSVTFMSAVCLWIVSFFLLYMRFGWGKKRDQGRHQVWRVIRGITE